MAALTAVGAAIIRHMAPESYVAPNKKRAGLAYRIATAT